MVNTGSSCKRWKSRSLWWCKTAVARESNTRGQGSIESSCSEMAIWCSIFIVASQRGLQIQPANQDHFYWSRMMAIWSFTDLKVFGLRTLPTSQSTLSPAVRSYSSLEMQKTEKSRATYLITTKMTATLVTAQFWKSKRITTLNRGQKLQRLVCLRIGTISYCFRKKGMDSYKT